MLNIQIIRGKPRESLSMTDNTYNNSFQDHLDKPVPECQTILDFGVAKVGGSGGGANRNYRTP